MATDLRDPGMVEQKPTDGLERSPTQGTNGQPLPGWLCQLLALAGTDLVEDARLVVIRRAPHRSPHQIDVGVERGIGRTPPARGDAQPRRTRDLLTLLAHDEGTARIAQIDVQKRDEPAPTPAA